MTRDSRRSGVVAVIFAWGLLAGLTGCFGQYGSGYQSYHDGGHGSCATGNCGHSGCSTCGLRAGPLLNNGASGRVATRVHGAPYQTPNPGDPQGPWCPSEKQMVSLPPHKVAPPDILLINAIRLVPRPPYRIEPLEALLIYVPDTDTLPKQPIAGPYTVTLDGAVNLGYGYGSVNVGGMTPDDAQRAIRRHLSNILKNNPQVNVALAQFRGMEQIRGEHLVRPDGTISLGQYGAVYVAGLSLGQVKCVVEKHLSEYLVNPQVSVDVFAYNSRMYYVIVDGGGYGQQVIKLPATGNETVIDAIAAIQGLAPVSSARHIQLARPSPANHGCNQILPVDWRAITEGGSTATNYQIFPGDRIYVGPNRLIAADNRLAQILAPIERIFGITLLGSSTFQSLSGSNSGNTGLLIR
jgi:polysaccharide export outer membrane protein